MYSPEIIREIHAKLQALDSSALVLLGGSYLYNEATESSDLDFYFIFPSWQIFFLNRLKKTCQKLKEKFPGVNISVMFVPRWLRQHGYYIYGRDLGGKIHTWKFPITTLIRNCLKLAYFNYLRFLVSDEAGAPVGILRNDSSRHLTKAKKQLMVAELAAQQQIDFKQPIFSWAYLSSRHVTIPSEMGVSLSIANRKFTRFFTFSWLNYFLYNSKFLFRGNPLFVFHNPDKMIIERLQEGFNKNEDMASLYHEMKEIIFPVIIL